MSSANDYPVRIAAVILAAGRSVRMGRPKLLLPWGQSTVIGHLVSIWREAGARQVVPVCAADNPDLDAELDRLGHPRGERIINPAPERGMFSSVQCAARWNGWQPRTTHWAIVLGDQPHLRRSTLAAVVDECAWSPDCIVQPSWQGRAGHPVMLPGSIWAALADAGETTLRDFLGRFHGRNRVRAVDDPGLSLDIDRPEDYRRALALAAQCPLTG